MAILGTDVAVRNSIAAIVRATRIANDLDVASLRDIEHELYMAAEQVAQRRQMIEIFTRPGGAKSF